MMAISYEFSPAKFPSDCCKDALLMLPSDGLS